MNDLKTELETLREDLRRCGDAAAATLKSTATEASQSAAAEFERLLSEIKDYLAETESKTEDFIAAHPVAAIASAFIAGVVVGRSMGRQP
jgi:ElaB/YqjD/DUF883 family membrane-anchored ribosome-binding protein